MPRPSTPIPTASTTWWSRNAATTAHRSATKSISSICITNMPTSCMSRTCWRISTAWRFRAKWPEQGNNMTATALDSAIFRDIFTTPAMREVFSDERRTAYYLEIEIQCRIENIDLARLKQQTERIGYPILGVVQQIVGLCADGLGEWCHWGATTQDITDTAAIMQIRAALELV